MSFIITYEQGINKVKEILKTQRYYNSIRALMAWDLWQGLSNDGRSYRGEVNSFFVKEASQFIYDNDTKRVVEFFRSFDENNYKNTYDKAAVRIFIKKFDLANKVPLELQIKMNNFTSEAQMVWRQALNNSDFNLYKPYLKKMFELKTDIAQSIDNSKNPFEVLVNEVDEGLGIGKVEQLFDELKVAIKDILKKTENKNSIIDNRLLNFQLDRNIIKSICTNIVESTYIDKNKVTYSEVIHPVCIGVGPRDIRITTHFQELMPSIFSILHECGHGIYEYSSNDAAVDYGIWGGISGALHESQSRFYENFIGKSKEFLNLLYPTLQDNVKELRNVEFNSFYNAVNKIRPSLKRMEADELTYNLHPIIRFEMENEYFEGKIKTDDFYEVWNAKYKEYLGIEPQNAKEGVLQDIHWASGHVGYFQSYTLGNIYGGQFRNKILHDIPNLYQQIAEGNFENLNTWNYTNIHQYGNLYIPKELLLKVTGEELQSKYFIDYLYSKFI